MDSLEKAAEGVIEVLAKHNVLVGDVEKVLAHTKRLVDTNTYVGKLSIETLDKV